MSDLITGDLFSALNVYYGRVSDYDSLSWGNLLLRKKIKGWGRHERLVRLYLEDIFATGLPQEGADRY